MLIPTPRPYTTHPKMLPIQRLRDDYPWIQTPLVVGAPMRLIALGDLAVEISKAGMYSPTRHPTLYT
jgi:hypothetical protein